MDDALLCGRHQGYEERRNVGMRVRSRMDGGGSLYSRRGLNACDLGS